MAVLTVQDVVINGLAIISALLYVVVGRVLSQRSVSPAEQGPLRGFVAWWYGIAFIGIAGIVLEFGINVADLGLEGVLAVIYVLIGLIYVAIGGLVYYLVYLHTGSKATFWWVVGYYVLQMVFLVWLIQSQGPYIGTNDMGEAELMFSNERPTGDPVSLLFSLGLLLPPLGAAIAYFALFFRLDQRTLKYRVAMVSGGLILWFTYSLFGTVARAITGAEEAGFLTRLGGQVLGITAGLLVLAAYFPPTWLRSRLGVESIQRAVREGGR